MADDDNAVSSSAAAESGEDKGEADEDEEASTSTAASSSSPLADMRTMLRDKLEQSGELDVFKVRARNAAAQIDCAYRDATGAAEAGGVPSTAAGVDRQQRLAGKRP